MGGILQLFIRRLDAPTLTKVLQCFGIENPQFHSRFCKCNLVSLKTAQKLAEMSDELAKYYLPCKHARYVARIGAHACQVINARECVTLLRQVLRLHGYALHTMERYHYPKTKCVHYQISPIGTNVGLIFHNRSAVVRWD